MTEIKNHFLNKFSEKLTSLQKLCTFCSLEVSLDLLRLTISLPEFIVKAMHLLVNVTILCYTEKYNLSMSLRILM